MSLWDDVKKNLLDWYAATSDKTVEVTRVTSLKYDKFGISRDIERQFSELGNVVYTGLKEGRDGLLEEEAVRALMGRIEVLEQELAAKAEEIEAVRRKAAGKKAQAGGGDAAPDGPDEGSGPDKVLTVPALDPGRGESAILVEPVGDDLDEHDPRRES
ncbi:MAG: hypothetical protein AB7V45_05730 [Candidatus Krumholzibacteriia bacterium]